MRTRFAIAVVTAWVLGTPEVSHAQLTSPPPLSGAGTTVTLHLPLNLTQLSSDLGRVRLLCQFDESEALRKPPLLAVEHGIAQTEVPVLGGQLVTTMTVMVPILGELLTDPIGKRATYRCEIMGFSKSLQRWGLFSETATEPAFVLKPAPSIIFGEFTW